MCSGSTRVFIVQIKVSIRWWNFIRSSCQRSYRDGGSFGVGLKNSPNKSLVNFQVYTLKDCEKPSQIFTNLVGCGTAGGGRGAVGIGIERVPVPDVCTPTADVLRANL